MTNSKIKGIIGIALIALLVVLALVADVLCGVYSATIGLYFKTTEPISSGSMADAVAADNEVNKEIAAEGCVLLKNENSALPLASTVKQINLFGIDSYGEVYLGTGSAGGWNWKEDDYDNLKDCFAASGVTVNNDLWTFYADRFEGRNDQTGGVTNMNGASNNIPELDIDIYGETLLSKCKAYSNTAFVMIGRAGGEGGDAVMSMNGKTNGQADKSYLELQDIEIKLLNYVKNNYANVIVLVNTAVPIECGWADEVADTGKDTVGDVDAVLWIGLPGTSGNYGVVDVITGAKSPSGRLVDTWATEIESAPSYYNVGDFTYANAEATQSYNSKYMHYLEGIYVGYRWYETANAEGVQLNGIVNYNGESKNFNFANYDSVVTWSFGYGLSYTTFTQTWDSTPTFDAVSNTLTFNVKVTNSGSVASKTPVEIYCEQPYTEGGTEKAKVVLVGFAKTDVIEAGRSQVVSITVDKDDLASYDYKTEKCYVLDAGNYKFYCDTGSYGAHCWANPQVLTWSTSLTKEVYGASNARSSDSVAAVNQFDYVTKGDGSYTEADYLTRANFVGTFPQNYADSKNLSCSSAVMALMSDAATGYGGVAKADDTTVAMPTTGADNGLSCEDLIGVAYDDPLWDKLLDQLSVEDMVVLTGRCGWSNPVIASVGKKFCVDMDGAEGLHDLTNGVSGNCFPCSVMIASTWNKPLAEKMGSLYADECLANGVSSIYAFSMNTHRTPIGGRSFEYYSEDGFLGGTIAAGSTSGLQKKGVNVFSKHFVVNDQEVNRGGVHVWLNEQSLREIYMRSFEIVVKTSETSSDVLKGGTGIMTSYNAIGYGWTSANQNLLTNVVRGEWGFMGRFVTDAVGTSGYNNGDYGLRAGTDMFLCPMGEVGRYTTATTQTAYGVQTLREACKHILFVYCNSSAIASTAVYHNAWVLIPIGFTLLCLAGAALVFIKMVYPVYIKKEERNK